MDRLQELDILIARTCESIYRKCYDGKMSDAESDYFISMVVSNLTMGIVTDTRNRLRGNAEWIDVNGDGSIMKCSKCGEEVCCKNNNFCPNCGSSIRKEGKENASTS